MEYCMAAASSPFAPPNCSRSILPKAGSGVPTSTVYINSFTWWYTGLSLGFPLRFDLEFRRRARSGYAGLAICDECSLRVARLAPRGLGAVAEFDGSRLLKDRLGD